MSANHSEQHYDIIILGTGLGGLVCGYILSKNGFKVLLLEKNAQIGGCLQTFKRFGVKYDTGMHYIGSMLPGQILHRLFHYLNLLDDVKLSRLDENAYDVFSIAGKQYQYASGYEHFIDTLAQQFPNHRHDLREYTRRLQAIADASPLYNLRKVEENVFIEADYIKTSINDFIASVTADPTLQDVLAGNLPLYAGVKDKTPTYIHALINNFYIQSAWRIIGGSDCIARSLADSIRRFGGEIRTRSEACRILCDEHKATGVELTTGEVIEADSIISNFHPQATIDIIDSHLIRKAYRDRIHGLENTISNFTVYIKFKENSTPYLNYNYYYYEHDDVWKANDRKPGDPLRSYLFMHQCAQDNQQWAQSAEMIGYMRFDEVQQWADTKVGHRGEAYREFKERTAEHYLDVLERSFPGIRACIEDYETSSPLTYRDYTATRFGSMYGIIRDKNFPTQTLVSQRTKIPNLFMTGQNINSHGIPGVTIGAALTCAEFLGLNKIIDEIENNNS
ncbi:MAG: NAD(P)/FAD-dependent oxidoreductase [Bacteroidales bacterium]|nr:NAD(P)/FAD-dependent oxidoreductase [Bacteroidales bacterium]